MSIFPTELYYHILYFCDGFERENFRPVCKMFNDFRHEINTDNPYRDKEVLQMDIDEFQVGLYGHMDILRLPGNKKKSNVGWALYGACYGGHADLVEMLSKKGTYDWDYALAKACEGGHVNVAVMMLEKGADANCGLFYSCRGGHTNIIGILIKMGANKWNHGIRGACKGGHIDIVKLMIELSITALGDSIEWDEALYRASKAGHGDIVKLLANHCKTVNYFYENECILFDNDSITE